MTDYEKKMAEGSLEKRFQYAGAIQIIIMGKKIFDTDNTFYKFTIDRLGKEMAYMVRAYDKETKKQTRGINLNCFLEEQTPEKIQEFQEELKNYIR